MANMIVVVYPAMAEANRDTAFEWHVGSDWDECSSALMAHFDERGWPYNSGDLIVEVEYIDDLSDQYERETAQRLVDYYKGRGLDASDVGFLTRTLHGLKTSWGTKNCVCALRAAQQGWSIKGLSDQADDGGWSQSAAAIDGRTFVEGILEADGDGCPDWILDNIDYAFLDSLGFVNKVSLAGETYYVYLND